jgi:CheY-like chemotaxis protein
MTKKKKIFKYATAMLIDDSEIDNFINMKMMEGCNFAGRVYVHTNGRSALEFLKNIERMEVKEQALFPDVIFLDLNMPIIDGYQFIDEFEKITKALKNKTKIIILTTSLNPSDQERSKNYPQITGYINKPLTCELIDTI